MIDMLEPRKVPAIPEFTVTELSRSLKLTIEETFSVVKVRGEISGLKSAPSGHLYFNLKDSESLIAAVCWKGVAGASSVKLEEGLEVILTGKLSIYAGRSTYQIIVSSFEAAGEGALLALLEKRKKEYQAEGLFDESKKKPIPKFPSTIAVITSPTGAVIRDILHRISERFPTHVIVWPTNVQGEGAAAGVASAINQLNNMPDNMPKPDVIIVARGGGSVEDLWAFNEDVVVRAAYASHIPIISAIGHETDFTLLDFVADKRAPTPTAAAEMATPVLVELRKTLDVMDRMLASSLPSLLSSLERRLMNASISLLNFSQKLSDLEVYITTCGERIVRGLQTLVEKKEYRFGIVQSRLSTSHIERNILNFTDRNNALHQRLDAAYTNIINRAETRISGYERLLSSLNYKRVLERGFSVARNAAGKVIRSRADAATAFSFELEFADGSLDVMPKVKKSKKSDGIVQMDLFE